jgi:hypothetical protein
MLLSQNRRYLHVSAPIAKQSPSYDSETTSHSLRNLRVDSAERNLLISIVQHL